jgi:hypothetical protein
MCINADPKWVFKNIHPDTLGNYNPGRGQACTARDAAQVERHKLRIANEEAGPSSAASDNTPPTCPTLSAASGSTPLTRPVHPDESVDTSIQLGYGDGIDDDTRMGPINNDVPMEQI